MTISQPSGSTRSVALEVTPEQASYLIALLKSGRLREHGILQVRSGSRLPQVRHAKSNGSTITLWIREIETTGDKDREDVAAAKLWERYSVKLMQVARRHLGGHRSTEDEEDLALSAFGSFCHAARSGNFLMSGRDDLWAVLHQMTKGKVLNHLRKHLAQKRGPTSVLSDLDTVNEIIAKHPSAESLATMTDEIERLMGKLRDDNLKEIAVLKLQGYTNQEIAELQDVSPRTVERRLRLIRSTLTSEYDND